MKQSLTALLQFFFVLVVGVAAQADELHGVHIAQCAAEILGVLQNFFLRGDALFRRQLGSGLLTDLLAVKPCGLDALLRALVQVGDLFFRLLKGKINLLFCQRENVLVQCSNDGLHKLVGRMIAEIDGNLQLILDCLFVGVRVDMWLFEEDEVDTRTIKPLIRLKALFRVSGHPADAVKHNGVIGAQRLQELIPFLAV